MATKSVPSYTLDDSSHYYDQLHLQFAPHACFSQATSWSPDKSQGQACLHCLQGRGFMCWWRRVKVAQWMWHVAPPHVPRVTSYGAVPRTTADTRLDARQETDARKKRCPWFEPHDIPQTCMCHVILSPLIRFPFRLWRNVTLSSIFCDHASCVNYVQL